jgi:serine/threonine-protein kinase RsbW
VYIRWRVIGEHTVIAKLTLELPEEMEHVRKARRVAVCLLEDELVAREDVDDVELVIGEICTNVVRHAHSAQGQYRVTLELCPDRLGVTVEDRGPGFDPAAVPPPGTERPDGEAGGTRFGGLGMVLAEALSDRLVFRATDPADPAARGMTVYAEKQFDAVPQSAEAAAR